MSVALLSTEARPRAENKNKGVDVGWQQKVCVGGGSGGGQTPGRRTSNKVHGGDDRGRSHEEDRGVQGGSDGGRSQGGDRTDPEQEEPGETQATAMMAAHGGAGGERSHGGGRADDSRGPTDGGGAGGGGPRGEDGESMILGDTKDLEGQGGAQG
ncbi:hypothetical protein H4Q32_010550 [Labeo rohita]|uniref:Uncharacterized protein n=1 Tax=Labeo rohita TaxID=84645 RepID=A0ABQ8MUX8_LABRO|nr:hypothetical protein H4Q32_010550 [Labeo rohita]